MTATTRLSVPAGFVNTGALARLADNGVAAMAASFGALPLALQESMARLSAERTQEINDAAAKEILNLKQLKDDFLVARAQAISALEVQIADNKKLMASAQLADQYGDISSNYLPLAKMMGQGVSSDVKKELLTVPNTFTPAAAAPAATTAAPAATA